MPATNALLLTEQRLWTIALAWPEFANNVKLGNRIRFDQLNIRWPDQALQAKQPADYVRVTLDVPGSGTPDPRAPRTFCIQPDVTTYDFSWQLVAGDHRINVITQVHAELKAAMVAAGTQLGIPAIVARWEHQMRPGKASAKERQLVWIQRITIKS